MSYENNSHVKTFVLGEDQINETNGVLGLLKGTGSKIKTSAEAVANHPVTGAVGGALKQSAQHAVQAKMGKEVLEQVVDLAKKILPDEYHVYLDTKLGRTILANGLNLTVVWLRTAEIGTAPAKRLSELSGREIVPIELAAYITRGMADYTMIDGLSALDIVDKIMQIVPQSQLKAIIDQVFPTSDK